MYYIQLVLYMSDFYPLRIKHIEKTGSDCCVISLEVEEHLKDVFDYTQGQYVTFRAQIDGEEIRRSYSLCSAPMENEWKVAVKKVDQGRFSTFANEKLQVGDSLDVMPPQGRFFINTYPNQSKNYVAFAAGSGITPIISLIKTHLFLEPACTFKLFYVNQSVSSIILKEEVEGLKNKYLDRFQVFHFLTREHRSAPLFNGRLDKEKLGLLFQHFISQEDSDDFFICGPYEMIFMIRDYLSGIGIEEEIIHFELFNTEKIVKEARKEMEIDPSLHAKISIIEGGKTLQFYQSQGGQTLLDAALENKADLPFACKGGVCCTCRAKVLEGKVDMLVNFGLEPEELDQGYVLTCQAIPQSESVVVDFDA